MSATPSQPASTAGGTTNPFSRSATDSVTSPGFTSGSATPSMPSAPTAAPGRPAFNFLGPTSTSTTAPVTPTSTSTTFGQPSAVTPPMTARKETAVTTLMSWPSPEEPESTPGPPLKRTKTEYDHFVDTVKVLVGSEEQAFIVHKIALCGSSPFFAAACSSHWIEGTKREVKLPEIVPAEFAVYFHWVYTKRVNLSFMPHDNDFDKEDPTSARYLSLGKAWILANYFQDSSLCNALADCIRDKLERRPCPRRYPAPSSIKYIWDHTPPGSTIRQLLVDGVVVNYCAEELESNAAILPHELILGIAVKFVAHEYDPDEPEPKMQHRCYYHVHEDGEDECS